MNEIVTGNPSRKRRSEKAVIVGREAGVIPMPLPPEPKMRYRVDLPIMCLAFKDNHHAAVTIQAGKVFEVIGPAQDDRFVVVEVKGEQFLVFESDLKDCGKPVLDAAFPTAAHNTARNGLR